MRSTRPARTRSGPGRSSASSDGIEASSTGGDSKAELIGCESRWVPPHRADALGAFMPLAGANRGAQRPSGLAREARHEVRRARREGRRRNEEAGRNAAVDVDDGGELGRIAAHRWERADAAERCEVVTDS